MLHVLNVFFFPQQTKNYQLNSLFRNLWMEILFHVEICIAN